MTRTSPLRVLYLPNERGEQRQRGPRRALSDLREVGLVADVRVFSPRLRTEADGSRQMIEDLHATVQAFRPDVVLVQHPEKTGITFKHWLTLRALAPFCLVYQEGDAYDRFVKRLPQEARAAARAADVTFSVGASGQQRLFRAAGAGDVRWCPSTFSPDDFGQADIPSGARQGPEVVMIANHSPSRVPLRSMPGCREREHLVKLLSDLLGDRFAAYGSGWNTEYACGPLPYLQQERVVREATMTVNWDHYQREALFFSDRLPIALASGTIHVTSEHPGYLGYFGDELPFLRFAPTVHGVAREVMELLECLTPQQITERKRAGRDFAALHFRQDNQVVELLNAGGAAIDPELARASWNQPVATLAEV